MERKVSERSLRKARELLAGNIPLSKYLSDVTRLNLDTHGKMCCPVHDESTPSFHYNDERKTGNCFGCHVGGTVVELHMYIQRKEIEGYSQVRAVKDLSRKYSIEIPDLFVYEVPESDRIRKSTRKRGDGYTDEYYYERLRHLTKSSMQCPLAVRLEISKTLDDIYMGRTAIAEGYTKCVQLMNRR